MEIDSRRKTELLPRNAPPDKKGEWEAQAIDQQSDFFKAYTQLANELRMNIAITYLEKFSPKPRNTVSIINRNGVVVLNYSKVFICNFGQEELQKEQYQLDDVVYRELRRCGRPRDVEQFCCRVA